MSELILKEESYSIIGLCMEVHNQLGHGFSEIVYKDALEIEFQQNDIFYEREREFLISYKSHILKTCILCGFRGFQRNYFRS